MPGARAIVEARGSDTSSVAAATGAPPPPTACGCGTALIPLLNCSHLSPSRLRRSAQPGPWEPCKRWQRLCSARFHRRRLSASSPTTPPAKMRWRRGSCAACPGKLGSGSQCELPRVRYVLGGRSCQLACFPCAAGIACGCRRPTASHHQCCPSLAPACSAAAALWWQNSTWCAAGAGCSIFRAAPSS